MSQQILRRSKLICYFKISPSLEKQVHQLYRPQTLPLSLYHYHYPTLYFPSLFNHFKIYLPSSSTPCNLRLFHNSEQLPLDLPIGLFVQNFSTIQISYSPLPCPQAFKMMINSWKRGYTIVNRQSGCDHVYKKLNLQSQMQLFNLHRNGHSHGLHRISKYEGSAIAIRLVIDKALVQRKEDNLKLTILQYLEYLFGKEQVKKIIVFTHGIEISLDHTLKQLLEEWNYNDGFCYLKIESIKK